MITQNRATAAIAAAVALLAAVAASLGVMARDTTYVAVTSARGETYEAATSGLYAWNSRQLVAEGIGWDIFTLVVAVPVLLIAATFVARGSFRGLLVTGGMLGYFAYMYLEYAVTWAFGPLFAVFIPILAGSVVGLVAVGAALSKAGLADRFDRRFPRRSWAVLSIGMALILSAMWIGRIAAALTAETPVLDGEVTMTVQALDLGLIVPISVMVAVSALRRDAVGMAAAAAFATMFVAMSAAIASMMVSAAFVTGVVALPPMVGFGLAATLGLLIAIRMHRSMTAAPPAARPAPLTASPAASADVVGA